MKRLSAYLFRQLKRSKILGLAVKIGLTLTAFALVFRGVNMVSLRGILRQQNSTWLLFAVMLIMSQVILGALRWRLILTALSGRSQALMRKLTALRLYYISVFFNNCLPGTVGGDVIRVWLAKSDHVPMALAIHSVIIDRIIALLGLCVMVIATLPLLGHIMRFDGWVLVPGLSLAILAAFWLAARLDRLLGRFQHIPMIRWLLYFASSIRLLLSRPFASMTSLSYAILSHASLCICAWVLAKSLNIDISALECLTLIPPVILMTTIPVSIGGWGLREAGMVGMLGLVGVPQAEALMLSIQIGLISIVVSLPAGFLWLTGKTQRA